MTPKSYEVAMAGPQDKEWYVASKPDYDSQIARSTFSITTLPYDHKTME